MRCDTCGFRSAAHGFFRCAKGGILDRTKTVCEGCDPYQPSLYERRLFRNVFVLQVLWLVVIAWTSLGLVDDPLSLFLMVEGALLTTVIRTAIHEAGHAAAAAALGAKVLRVTVGHGPTAHQFRWQGVRVDVRRYAFMGGQTHMAWPSGESPRWRSILVLLAGPGANAAFALLAFWLASSLQQGWLATFASPLLSGFGVSQAITAIYNLWPSTFELNGLPSDGRQVLALMTSRNSKPDKFVQALLRAQAHLVEERHKAAADAFWEAAQLKPDATLAFAMTMHCLNQAEGGAAAMAFFRTNRAAFEASMATTDDVHRTMVPYLQANIAMPALSSDPPLADIYSRAALDALPEIPAMIGTRGAYLILMGEVATGRGMLLQAIRGSTSGNDRAEFAEALARADRAAGDAERAEAFEDLGRYARAA